MLQFAHQLTIIFVWILHIAVPFEICFWKSVLSDLAKNVTFIIDKMCSLSADFGKEKKKSLSLCLTASDLFWGKTWALDTAEKDVFYNWVS